jgi:ectoine hydroxylase-related dioxygenase (phytanoyl-CoA dioxygenase family)
MALRQVQSKGEEKGLFYNREVVLLDSNGSQGHFKMEYEIMCQKPDKVIREVNVHATKEEIDSLTANGYMVREKMFQGEALERLRAAMDRMEEKERQSKELGQFYSTDSVFGGLYIRRLPDKDQEFMDLVYDPSLLSVARAMMGPQLLVLTMARITYPGEPNQETHWHQHLFNIPVPQPPWFTRPHSMDILIYLDDVDEETGPISLVPGSHNRLDSEPAPNYYGQYPNQLTLMPSAGTALFIHSNVWHRALPTTEKGRKRRLLLICYQPTWFKRIWSDAGDGLVKVALENGNDETRELFGQSGYN